MVWPARVDPRRRARLRNSVVDSGIVAALLVGAILMMMPFAWMLSTSVRSGSESFSLPPQWLPRSVHLENYQTVLDELPFFQFILNSLEVSTLITIGQLVTCSTAAYAFARLHFPGREALFVFFLSSLMVPIQVTIIPIFILIRILGLLDTHASLIIPALVSAFGVFLLRQFFLTIPREIEDAARVDGAGSFTIYRRIILPLAGPGLSTLAIFAFNFYWNEFFRPLLFLSTWSRMTLPIGLTILRGYLGTGNVGAIMAGISMAVVPVLVLFVFAQRYLIEGITLTGLKG